MSGNISDRPIPRPKRRIADRVVPRPKVRIAPRVIPRAKHVLPEVEMAQAAGEKTGEIRPNAPGSSGKNVQGAQSGVESTSSRSDKQKESAEARESKIEIMMKIRRRSHAGILAESFGLNSRQNDIRFNELPQGRKNLRSARRWLKELRDNAPSLHLSSPPNSLNTPRGFLFQ